MFEFGFGRHGSGGREDGGSGERGLVSSRYRFERSYVCVVRPDDDPGLAGKAVGNRCEYKILSVN